MQSRAVVFEGFMHHHSDESDYSSADEGNHLLPSHGQTLRAFWSFRRVATLCAGIGCCAACILLFTSEISSHHGQTSTAAVTLRVLLEGRDMKEIATNNLMNSSDDVSRDVMRAHVARGVLLISHRLGLQEVLDTVLLTHANKLALLHVIGYLGDSRVQNLGYEIAHSVHQNKYENREDAKRRFVGELQPRLGEMRVLRDEIYPATLRELVGDKWQKSRSLDESRIFQDFSASPKIIGSLNSPERARRLVPEEGRRNAIRLWHMPDVSRIGVTSDVGTSDVSGDGNSAEHRRVDKASEIAVAVLGGLLEQCRVMLDQADFLGDVFGSDLKIPPWAKSLVGGLDFAAQLSECSMRSGNDQDALYMCPMKYGSALFDMLSCIDDIAGLEGDA
eukprot:TRINITY_DN61792_c0_g1_i1.p1 TRINITY_DN61792_c0_g1~~TRINITY_DN61792_c0_g1_i1.p1  ORF type:complete len:390 (-),score=56.90 TRINITY_DN61792_c0_g1_i1:339-1508(-)